MKIHSYLVFAFALGGTTGAASNIRACPLLGQQYPAPTQLSSSSQFKAATAQIDSAIRRNARSYSINETSLSIGMFSVSEPGLLYQYHHTDALLANSSHGTRRVDADSIYRIGSISKLFTMYMFLIQNGDRHFNDPIAEHVPALLGAGPAWNPVTPQWNDITIGELAGQMGGLARDYGLADLAAQGNGLVSAFGKAAFPHLPAYELPKCGYERSDGSFSNCSAQEYIDGVASESPVFATAYTPVYSNEAFALIGFALEQISKKLPQAIFDSQLVNALGLKGTSYTVPSTTPESAVIPGSPLKAGWNVDLGIFGP